MIWLGIETSCDETAAAVLDNGVVRSNVIHSQVARHAPHGGIVPEIASRDHVRKLPSIISTALHEADVAFEQLDAIAVTCGPGLASSLLIGYAAARALGQRLAIPVSGIHHHEGHIYSVFLGDQPPDLDGAFPMLTLLASGGDTRLVYLPEPGQIQILGQTIDDAAGEALDKGSILMGLGYPGGPAVQRAAEGGDPHAVRFPRGLDQPSSSWTFAVDRDLCFSFSGLKTALLYHLRNHPDAPGNPLALRDLAASYQEAVTDALTRRIERALNRVPCASFACAGGVSLNRSLREKLGALSQESGIPLHLSAPDLCTDNAAMIAGAAWLRHQFGAHSSLPDDIHPTLPLTGWK